MRSPLFVAILAGIIPYAQPSRAESQQLFERVQELQIQQVQIADNQTKAESRMADLKETVRVARIYASRAGGPRKLRLSSRKR